MYINVYLPFTDTSVHARVVHPFNSLCVFVVVFVLFLVTSVVCVSGFSILFSLTIIQKLCEGYRYVCMYQFISMFQNFLFPFYNVRFYIKWNILLIICNQTSYRNHCTLSLTARRLFQLNIIIDLKTKTKTKTKNCWNNSKIKYQNRRKRQNRYLLHTNKTTKSQTFSDHIA